MKSRLVTAAVLASGLIFACTAQAQQPAAPAPISPDAIPDKMPFSTPYGAPISLQKAEAAKQAAIAEADKRGWQMNVAVVDSGANLVTFSRMDGAHWLRSPSRGARPAPP